MLASCLLVIPSEGSSPLINKPTDLFKPGESTTKSRHALSLNIRNAGSPFSHVCSVWSKFGFFGTIFHQPDFPFSVTIQFNTTGQLFLSGQRPEQRRDPLRGAGATSPGLPPGHCLLRRGRPRSQALGDLCGSGGRARRWVAMPARAEEALCPRLGAVAPGPVTTRS